MEGYREMDPFIDRSHDTYSNSIFYATREPLTPPESRPSGGKNSFQPVNFIYNGGPGTIRRPYPDRNP